VGLEGGRVKIEGKGCDKREILNGAKDNLYFKHNRATDDLYFLAGLRMTCT